MPEREDIHACWSLKPRFDKKTGEKITAGLFALGGHGGDGALRELKKRCDAEIKYAEKPLAGCAMYVNLVMSWAKTALEYRERVKGTEVVLNYAADKSFRKGFERSLHIVGEDEIVDIIEDAWSRYNKDGEIPDSILMDIEDDIAAILKDEYCDVGLVPENFSPAEIRKSKEIALTLGRRKRPKKPARKEIESETAIEETSHKKPDIRAEIENKINKAR